MKCIIAGSRDFIPAKSDYNLVKHLVKENNITQIVSGGAKGTDAFGEEMAELLDIKLKIFSANWDKYGNKAGPLRNREMADYADCVILFKGGEGTNSMRKEILIHNKKILYDANDVF